MAKSNFKKHKRTIIAAAVCSLAVVSILAIFPAIKNYTYGSAQRPDYQTVAPYGKSAQELGGWKRVSPPDQDPVFAYTDTIDDVSISVSQQQLPESFLSDTEEQVAELAKKFNATTKIDAFGTTAYLGTSAKGPQSVILTKNDLLIMIKSKSRINNQSWAEYIQSLVSQNES